MHRLTAKLPANAPRAAAIAALIALVAVVSATSAGAKTGRSSAGSVVFMSTQLTPVTEQQKFIDVTLKGFNGNVQFVAANSVNNMVTRINAEAQAGSGSVSLAGATVGDLETVARQADRPLRRRGEAEGRRYPAEPVGSGEARDEQAALRSPGCRRPT